MMTKVVEVVKKHQLAYSAACKRAEVVAGEMATEYGVKWHWEASTIHFEGEGRSKGIKGFLLVQPNQVRLRIELPLLFWALDGIVRDKVTEYLKTLDRAQPQA